MKNWSENVQWNPKDILYPSSEQEVAEIVKEASKSKRKIRAIGSGHSFTPVCATDDITISLDNMQNISRIGDSNIAYAQGGTKLYKLGAGLENLGLAQENLGDINKQSVAGALSTGTHGTGTRFGSISSQIEEVTFVNGKGEIHTVTYESDPDLFRSLQVSVGTLGIITGLKLRCIPAYNLHLKKKKEKLTDVLANLEKHNAENRNFEFYWLPHTEYTQTKYSNTIEQKGKETSAAVAWFNEVFLENYMLEVICKIAKAIPSLNPAMSKLTAAFIGNEEKIKASHEVFATVRKVKFTEMEYSVPMEHYQTVMQELLRAFEKNKYAINFPIENRFVMEDEPYLSTSYGRKSAYIACHAYKGVDNTKYFRDLEEIFQHYGGRPHWGKMHTCDANYLSKQYAKWDVFQKIREEQDPNQIFTNPHIQKIFGL